MAPPMSVERGLVPEQPIALCTLKGHFPGVDALVDGHVALLAELFAALGAGVRAFPAVNSLVDGQLGAFDEAFAAFAAHIRLLVGVGFAVFCQAGPLDEGLTAL